MKHKFGMTLAELVIAIGIISVCILASITIAAKQSPDSKALKYLYISAYSALEKAYYNSSIKSELASPFDATAITEDPESGIKALCDNLTFYINTVDNKCDTDDRTVDDLGTDLTDDNVKFVATNGMKFWISNLISDPQEASNGNHLKFYIVYVDVNGNKRPNSMLYTNKRGETLSPSSTDWNDRVEPDQFAFAILDTGGVCPIGAPEYDPTILTARVAYMSNGGDVAYHNKSMSYYEAKNAAWGFYRNQNYADLSHVAIDDPHTANDVVRSMIDANSNIKMNFPDLSSSTMSTQALMSSSPYGCANYSVANCFLFLDKYRY